VTRKAREPGAHRSYSNRGFCLFVLLSARVDSIRGGITIVSLLSLLPLLQGLYQTAHKICHKYGLDDRVQHRLTAVHILA
jgi:hypothetical protein